MALSDITDRSAVLRAIEEFDRIGRDAFLAKYRFGESRSYWLLHDGKRYDSKAIIGAAHGYARPDLRPMTAADFSGGNSTVRRTLNRLGFEVVVQIDGDGAAEREGFLLAWNESEHPHAEIELLARAVAQDGSVDVDWSIDSGGAPKPGMPIWLMTRGSNNIFASGVLIEHPSSAWTDGSDGPVLSRVRLSRMVDPLGPPLVAGHVVREILSASQLRPRTSGYTLSARLTDDLDRLLPATEFGGAGDQRAEKTLVGGDRTSNHLEIDAIYTRDDLRGLFGVTDATLNTGVFQPKGTSSVWLFITEEKTADRTQYRDRLDGDVLYWQGQTRGRTDPLIIQHAARGLELLVFMRNRKYEHPGAGFRYLGPFTYVRHSGGNPTDFVLQRVTAPPVARFDALTADEKPYDPTSIPDGRQRTMRAIAQRRGQKKFRDALMKAYGESCAISGCTVLDVLEAAHIHPYRGPETNDVRNGLLLRADLHTLFDCGLISVDPSTLTVVVDGSLSGSEYQAWHGRPLRPPKNPAHAPSKEALKMRKEERF
jgi:hypothetical protein